MKVYKSKIDLWLVIIVFLPIITIGIFSVMERDWEGAIIMLAITFGIIWLFRVTKYIIDDNLLRIKAGFLVNQQINIKDIISVKKTNNPLSAPALSIKRLQIKYGKNYDYALVSPREREDFVKQLVMINPDIKIDV